MAWFLLQEKVICEFSPGSDLSLYWRSLMSAACYAEDTDLSVFRQATSSYTSSYQSPSSFSA